MQILVKGSCLLLLSCLCSLSDAQSAYVEEGTASYYHDKFVGRKTASGEIFTQDKMTAAHKSLPLGTWVMVTNKANDSVVILRINDRMPQWNKRSIDLTYSAAERLGYIRAGLAKVRIEVIDPPNETPPPPDPGPPATVFIEPLPVKAIPVANKRIEPRYPLDYADLLPKEEKKVWWKVWPR